MKPIVIAVLLSALALSACSDKPHTPFMTGKITHIGKKGFNVDGGGKTMFINLDPEDRAVLKKLKKGDSVTIKAHEVVTSGDKDGGSREIELEEIRLSNGTRLPL